MIFLPLLPKHWEQRCALPCPVRFCSVMFSLYTCWVFEAKRNDREKYCWSLEIFNYLIIKVVRDVRGVVKVASALCDLKGSSNLSSRLTNPHTIMELTPLHCSTSFLELIYHRAFKLPSIKGHPPRILKKKHLTTDVVFKFTFHKFFFLNKF